MYNMRILESEWDGVDRHAVSGLQKAAQWSILATKFLQLEKQEVLPESSSLIGAS